MLLKTLPLSFRRRKCGAFQPGGRFLGEQARLLVMQGLCWDAVGGRMGKIGWGKIMTATMTTKTANTS